MAPSEFPYRAIGDEAIAAELHQQADVVNRSLADVIRAVVSIGRSIAWAQEQLRPEILHAWLYSEFGWKLGVADAFVDAAVNYDVQPKACRPAAAQDLVAVLAAKSVCAAELAKARRLLEAYRAIVKGDAAFTRWPRICRARSSIQGSRIRGRVYRAMLRRDTTKPDSNELE